MDYTVSDAPPGGTSREEKGERAEHGDERKAEDPGRPGQGEEMRGHRPSGAPCPGAGAHGGVCAIRFLLGGHAVGGGDLRRQRTFRAGPWWGPPAPGWTASPPCWGACFGYLSFQGFTQGLRYVAAAILIFSVSFAFYDVKGLPLDLVHARRVGGHETLSPALCTCPSGAG